MCAFHILRRFLHGSECGTLVTPTARRAVLLPRNYSHRPPVIRPAVRFVIDADSARATEAFELEASQIHRLERIRIVGARSGSLDAVHVASGAQSARRAVVEVGGVNHRSHEDESSS